MSHDAAAVSLPQLPEGRRVFTLAELVRQPSRLAHVVGAEGCAAALIARQLAVSGVEHVVCIAPDADTLRRTAADLSFLTRGGPWGASVPEPSRLLTLSAPDAPPWAEVHADRRHAMARAATLAHLASGRPWRFLVTTAAALTRRVSAPSTLAAASVELIAEDELDLAAVTTTLAAGGYLRVPVVEDPGSFAVRGGVLDVWPAGAALPVRAELYGDLLVSLKHFEPDDQRSLDVVERVWLPPARQEIIDDTSRSRARELVRSLCDAVNLPSTKARSLVEDVASGRVFFGMDAFAPAFAELVPLWTHLPEGAVCVVEDPIRATRAIREELAEAERSVATKAESPHFSLAALYIDEQAVAAELHSRRTIVAHRAGIVGTPANPGSLEALELSDEETPTLALGDQAELVRAVAQARDARGKQGALDPLIEHLTAWSEAGLSVAITARNVTQAERLGTLLSHRDVDVLGPGAAPGAGLPQVMVGELSRGVIAPALGFVLVTEEEIFGQRAHRREQQRKKSARAMLEDLRALTPGDWVVHVEHGIGRYLGLEKKSIGGIEVELIVVEYAAGDKLFLPVHRLNQIQKYSGGEGAPKMDRLGGQSFAKTKAKVQRRVRQMADELLKLYAERTALTKVGIDPPDDEYAAFEASFPFEETRDQAAAISEVLSDLTSSKVMDRLVCGDVGFGKTEVALRAAFRVALAGRQVALLCPTTVLAQQHLSTFSQRLAGYPIEVRALSRFTPKQHQPEIVRSLRDGTVDIVVGTHRLLSKDVHFANLGLLIVDEEQRFGVTHKERIKQLRASVDVLTLSATPIPRTLQMAVGGLRDMSIISTPPVDRRAIRTITSRFDEEVIRDAIRRELERGGQVFYVYNRIEGLHERAVRLSALVPEARVAVGHGQMSEAALEKTMLDFVEGTYDVLVSTAIIESGLDIPRANTMIVDRADMFGLSQLYQLRGRVGRSKERAYCYLLVPAPNQMTDEARSRLEALERHTQLGSGFHIATLDMELRGAGDVLGAEQSGFAASVGFELFCQMLEEAAHELRGEPVVHAVDPELSFDVEALLPEDYVSDVGVRLSLYKRLASAHDEAEVADLAAEMEDRFGPPPKEARRLVDLMRIKTQLRRLAVLGCEATARSVSLHLRNDTPLDPAAVGELVARKKSAYRLAPDGRLTRRAQEGESFADGIELCDKVLSELSALVKAT